MSKESLAHLRAVFGPQVFALDVDQLAHALGRATRGAKDHLRERIKRGDFPRARKDGGRWKVPLEEVAEILEPTPAPVVAPALPIGGGGYTSRRRSILGDLITFVRSAELWGLLCVALGWFPELEALNALASDARDELDALHVKSLRERFGERLPPSTKRARKKSTL